MNRTEYESLVEHSCYKIKTLSAKAQELYKQHISSLDYNRTDAMCHLTEAQYDGTEDVVKRLTQEIEDYSYAIAEKEKECGIVDVDNKLNEEHHHLDSLRKNAMIELTEYEYYTSNIPPYKDKIRYLAKHGLVESIYYTVNSSMKIAYNLNVKFEQDKHIPFLEGVTPFLKDNSVLNGESLVHFNFLFEDNMNSCSTIARNNKENIWYLLIEEDIVFSSDNLKDIFDYRNIVG